MRMIRSSALLLALVAAAAVPLQAQSRLTLLAGYSHAQLDAELAGGGAPRDPRTGFVPGVGITIGLAGRVGLVAEALYVRKGYATTGENTITGMDATRFDLDIRYAEFPLMLTARYPVGKAQLVVLGGATLGLRVQCAATIDSPDGSHEQNDCIDTDRGVIVPPTNLAITAGFGLAWKRFSLTGQYEVTGNDVPAFSPSLKLQHRTLLLLVGIDLLKTRDRM